MSAPAVAAAKPQDTLDERLIELCFAENPAALNTAEIDDCLAAGANAGHLPCNQGIWGAYQQRGALHGLLRPWWWKTPETAATALAVIVKLFAAGATPDMETGSSDWRGCSSASTAFSMAVSLASSMTEASGQNAEIEATALQALTVQATTLLRVFMQHGADADKESVIDRHSMRTDGRVRMTVLHDAISGRHLSLPVLAAIIPCADVTRRKTEVMHNERGYNSDSSLTALGILCKRREIGKLSSKEYHKVLVVAELLLAAGATPNQPQTWLTQRERIANPGDSTQDTARGDSNPRSATYICPVVDVVTVTTPLNMALAAGSAPLVWFFMAHGGDLSLPTVVCDKADLYSTYSMMGGLRAPKEHRALSAYSRYYAHGESGPGAVTRPGQHSERSGAAFGPAMVAALNGRWHR